MNDIVLKESPSFTDFNPRLIPWQYKAIKEIENADYSNGVREFLFSGTIGSAKSICAAHIGIHHVVKWHGSRMLIGRLVRKDLEETFAQDIHDHIEGDFEEGEDFEYNISKMKWEFWNGSEIISRYWHKKNWKQFRSLRLSAAIIEEANENEGEYWQVWNNIKQRIGRLPHVKQNFMIGMTNAGSPVEPIYKHFFIENNKFRKVFFSKTEDNPFLPKWYIENLKNDLSPTEVLRMLYGQWVDNPEGGIYYNYSRERNYRDETYIYNLRFPIDMMHDFNIGHGKPMSAAIGQVINGVFHVAQTFLIEGARTFEIMDEIAEAGIFERKTIFRVFGDASGRHNDTRSITSDYDIIFKFLSNYVRKDGTTLKFKDCVPRSNPPIRTRHNKVNAKFCNANNFVQLYIYKDAVDADEGFRLTKLKKGASYLEDDSFKCQHVTTGIGYWIVEDLKQSVPLRMTTQGR